MQLVSACSVPLHAGIQPGKGCLAAPRSTFGRGQAGALCQGAHAGLQLCDCRCSGCQRAARWHPTCHVRVHLLLDRCPWLCTTRQPAPGAYTRTAVHIVTSGCAVWHLVCATAVVHLLALVFDSTVLQCRDHAVAGAHRPQGPAMSTQGCCPTPAGNAGSLPTQLPVPQPAGVPRNHVLHSTQGA